MASSVIEQSTFQDYPYLNTLESKFGHVIGPWIIIWTNLKGPKPQMLLIKVHVKVIGSSLWNLTWIGLVVYDNTIFYLLIEIQYKRPWLKGPLDLFVGIASLS